MLSWKRPRIWLQFLSSQNGLTWEDGRQFGKNSKDLSGVALSDSAHAIDCSNSLLRSETPGQQIVGLGLSDIIAIAMPDAVLVAHKDRSQDVKLVVDQPKSENIQQAETFPKDHSHGDGLKALVIGDKFQVNAQL